MSSTKNGISKKREKEVLKMYHKSAGGMPCRLAHALRVAIEKLDVCRVIQVNNFYSQFAGLRSFYVTKRVGH